METAGSVEVVFTLPQPATEADNADNADNVRHRQASPSESVMSTDSGSWESLLVPLHDRGSLISLLSGLYALLLVILAFAFQVSVVVSESVESAIKYEPFYIYLYGGGLLFFAYCQAFLFRTGEWTLPAPFGRGRPSSPASPRIDDAIDKRNVTHAGPTAGSLYLRLGCVVFGVIGMIFHGLEMYGCLSSHAKGPCSGTFLFATALGWMFIFVQMYFIFQNSKLIIHRFKDIGRIGCMHLIATNLCVWLRYLVIEEFEFIQTIQKRNKCLEVVFCCFRSAEQTTTIIHLGNDPEHINPNNSELSSVLLSQRSSVEEEHVSLLSCDVSTHGVECFLNDYEPFLTTCLIEYSIICAAIMYVLWQNIGQKHPSPRKISIRKEKFHVDCSSSTKGLFLGLLFVVSTIIGMIVFFVKINIAADWEALWVFYSSDSVLYFFAIAASIVGLYRMRLLRYVSAQKATMLLLDDILLFVALFGQLMFCVFSVVALADLSLIKGLVVLVSFLRMIQVILQTIFILTGQRLVALTPELQVTKPGREIVTFLLMINLAFFLVNTFETQKASINPVMIEFYGKSAWTVIVHSTVPLAIFYRFHSSVCLAEIWKIAYRVKEPDE